MADAIAAGITGADEASGVIECSIPARARVDSKPKRTSGLLRAK
jgi:hypothetical protein